MYRGCAVFFWLLTRTVLAQYDSCDIHQNVAANSVYYISSPGYPTNYTGRIRCKWTVDCPIGYNCRLDCPWIKVSPYPNCDINWLLVSKNGNPQLNPAVRYCGHGSFSAVSIGQRMTIGLFTNLNTNGGLFRCQISAQVARQTETCTCGERRQNRIFGGEETAINEYKMMVGVIYVNNFLPGGTIACGAVIITDRHVLTAAHCLNRRSLNETLIVVGEHDVTKDDSPATKVYRIASFTIHPNYKNDSNDYDIAIINVAEPIGFNDRVGPVCLPFKFQNTDLSGQKVTILGWGTKWFTGPISDVLLKADVDVITEEECRSKEKEVTSRNICTFTPNKDSCQYDSGGPVLYTDPTTGLLFNVGIVSFGKPCGTDSPGVNTKVTALLPWVVANTQPNYCHK